MQMQIFPLSNQNNCLGNGGPGKKRSLHGEQQCQRKREQKHLRGRTVKEKELPEKLPEKLSSLGKTQRWQEDHRSGGITYPIAQPGSSPLFSACLRLSSSLTQGTAGFEAHIDKCLELAEYLYNIIKNREGYEMVFDGKVSLLIFKIPKCLVNCHSCA